MKNQDTITIRVPKVIAFQVIEIAHRLDSGLNIDLDIESKSVSNDFVIKTRHLDNENVIESKTSDNEKITKSIPSYNQAIEIAKKILKF